jgi:signal transduction histidine kinase
VLAALTAALVVSSVLTTVVAGHLTRSAVRAQSLEIASSDMSVLVQAFSDRERSLTEIVRSLAAIISNGRLLEPPGPALIQELGADARNLELDVLQVRNAQGEPISGAVVGSTLGKIPPALLTSPSAPTGGVIPTGQRAFVQVVAVPVESGPSSSGMLLGGYSFSDAYAYRLRNQLGNLGHVLLVVDGKLAGSTLPNPPDEPPLPDGAGGRLPTSPALVRIAGTQMLVGYVRVGSVQGQEIALGVALPDPVATLDRSLGRSRLVAAAMLVLVALGLACLLFAALTRPLGRLAVTARRIAEGDLDASFEARGRDEIARLAAALERMRLELRTHAQRVAESSKRVVTVQDEERRRLARDLHDGIQQQLVCLAVKLRHAAEVPPAEVSQLLRQVAVEAEESVFALQDLGRGIYPSVLADQGLAAALQAQSGRVPMRIRFAVPASLAGRRFRREVEAALYFVGLEAMANAQKHAHAAEVLISLREEEAALVLEIRDDGPGFQPGDRARGAGLRNMADRVDALGGVMSILTAPGAGTAIRARVPLGATPGGATERIEIRAGR